MFLTFPTFFKSGALSIASWAIVRESLVCTGWCLSSASVKATFSTWHCPRNVSKSLQSSVLDSPPVEK